MKRYMKSIRFRFRRLLLRFFIFLRRIRLPGFQGVGLYDVLYFFIRALSNPKFTLMASAMAYHFFFSLLPTLLLALIILSQLPFEPLKDGVIKFILQFFPEGGLDQATIENTVQAIMENYFNNAPNIWLVIVSILLAFWGSMRGIIGMMKAFSKQESLFESVFKSRKWWELYSMAFLILISVGSIIVAGVSLNIVSKYLFAMIDVSSPTATSFMALLSRATDTILTILTLFFVVSSLYFLAPATQERWKFFSPGAITASALTLAALTGLKYFFINFANYDKLYGSLAAIMVILVWFYYIAIVLLIGFELNAAIDIASRRLIINNEQEQLKANVSEVLNP